MISPSRRATQAVSLVGAGAAFIAGSYFLADAGKKSVELYGIADRAIEHYDKSQGHSDLALGLFDQANDEVDLNVETQKREDALQHLELSDLYDDLGDDAMDSGNHLEQDVMYDLRMAAIMAGIMLTSVLVNYQVRENQ